MAVRLIPVADIKRIFLTSHARFSPAAEAYSTSSALLCAMLITCALVMFYSRLRHSSRRFVRSPTETAPVSGRPAR
jgi:hypothetical protein